MNTDYANQVIQEIAEDAARLRSEFAARGIRDEITVQSAGGVNSVRGKFAPQYNFGIGPKYGLQSVADYARKFYGTGKLKFINRSNIQGRLVTRYEVI
jgi:hypothetical protein